MKVKIKKKDKQIGVIPSYAKQGDAGMDLTSTSLTMDEFGNFQYGTGLIMEIPEGFEGQVRPRSSIRKYDLALVNSPGTVDSGYRGEVLVVFRPTKAFPTIYKVGERIAQIVIKPVPYIDFEEVDELSESERGDGGYGSTGK